MSTTIKSKGKIVQGDEHRPKVSITLPRLTLERVDARAAEQDLSRSTVIQIALRQYFAGE